MADPDFFPGFEGDDEPPKPKTVAPQPQPAPAAPAPAGKPAPAARPSTNRVAKTPPAPTPAAPAADEDADDPELKPGSRKDLWKCPHCEAGNKPGRTNCRSCGKSPYDPVVTPWYRNNLVRAGILAGIGLVIIGVVWLSKVDLSLREPTLANVDAKAARISGEARGTIDLGSGMRFEAEQQFSVCGRVAAVGHGPGGTLLVALALGPAAAEEKPEAKPVDGTFEVDGLVLACTGQDAFTPKPGQILSLVGATGVLTKEGKVVDRPAGIIPVAVDEHRVQ